ncbi:MAG: alpha-galactosidase [Acidobacteriota bacterium]
MDRRTFLAVAGGAGLTPGLQGSGSFAPFELRQSGLTIAFDFLDRRLRSRFFLPEGVEPPELPKPTEVSGLDVAIQCTGENRKDHHGHKQTGSMPGGRLVFAGRREETTARGRRVVLAHRDEPLGLLVEASYEFFDRVPVVRRATRVVNEGARDCGIDFVSSAMLANFGTAVPADMERDLVIHFNYNSWCAEGQWQSAPPSRLGLSDNAAFRLSSVQFNNIGSWSTMKHLPVGMVENKRLGVTWFWQIEHNGSWHWELSNSSDKALYAYFGGPDEEHGHAWKNLAPGAVYETVPVAVGCVRGGFEEAVAALTAYRRAACKRRHKDNERCPVIFNDYMNCVEGDATTEKELPLIEAAAEAGCEYFVIDAGWYAELKETWWDAVGLWQPSQSRWPGGGLAAVLRRIRDRKMTPGLWLEIEVAGVRSPLAAKPDDWFMCRHGKRVIDNGRYLLDFRNPAVRAHADEVVDRLVREYGAGYIKMDYNVTAMMGTDRRSESLGQGLLEHQRALLAWYDAVMARYPELVIENCASGGGRMDYAMLSRLQLQSSSDQTDYRKYPAIVVGALAAVLPEQLAVWSYPLAGGDADEGSFNMVSAMLCRIHQSGHLARLNPASLAQVKAGLRIYKDVVRRHVPHFVPSFPLGMPSMADKESPVALRMRAPGAEFVAVWRLAGPETVRVAGLRGFELVYPGDLGITAGEGEVRFPRPHMAALLRRAG